MKGQWTTAVIANLRPMKDAGYTFNDAWDRTMKLYPPSRRDRDTEHGISLYAFFERSCSDAWAGRKPNLQWFGIDLLVGLGGDESHNAHRKRPEAA
jgi:hypothetical protein